MIEDGREVLAKIVLVVVRVNMRVSRLLGNSKNPLSCQVKPLLGKHGTNDLVEYLFYS